MEQQREINYMITFEECQKQIDKNANVCSQCGGQLSPNRYKYWEFGRIDHAGEKANFLMCQEYYDFIEFLQDKLSFEEVNDLQKEFGGSFYNPDFD